jgi:ribosomal protein L36
MFSARARPQILFLVLSIFITTGSSGLAEDQAAIAAKPKVPLFSHVAIVMEENHSLYQVLGALDAPYMNSLITNFGLAANYYANAHPSIPDYFMLTTGKIITKNDDYDKIIKRNNIVRILKKENLTWKAYIESLPPDPTKDSWPYLRHHNPFSFFSDVLDDPAEMANIVDFGQLAADILSNSVPDYSFIVPNAYHSGHGDVDDTGGLCANPNDVLAEADCWLQNEIDPLVTYMLANNGLLIVTWDEGDGADLKHGGGHIPTIVISSATTPGFKAKKFFQHQNTLRLSLQALGVKKYPGAAANASQMRAFFAP